MKLMNKKGMEQKIVTVVVYAILFLLVMLLVISVLRGKSEAIIELIRGVF